MTKMQKTIKLPYDERVLMAAKVLVKEYKENLKDENCEFRDTIFINDRFSVITQGSNRELVFDHDWRDETANISFGDIDKEGVANATRAIASKVKELLKLPKKVRVFTDERKETEWRGGIWSRHDYSYYWVNKIVMITPCKEFDTINRKLTHLGCQEVPFEKWFGGRVSGKRAGYGMDSKSYYATDKGMCDKVLDYLKGKKKVSYELVRDEDFADRERGIRYETEWSGSLAYRLKFKDAKGKETTIY